LNLLNKTAKNNPVTLPDHGSQVGFICGPITRKYGIKAKQIAIKFMTPIANYVDSSPARPAETISSDVHEKADC
jgi:hypothetical protein